MKAWTTSKIILSRLLYVVHLLFRNKLSSNRLLLRINRHPLFNWNRLTRSLSSWLNYLLSRQCLLDRRLSDRLHYMLSERCLLDYRLHNRLNHLLPGRCLLNRLNCLLSGRCLLNRLNSRLRRSKHVCNLLQGEPIVILPSLFEFDP